VGRRAWVVSISHLPASEAPFWVVNDTKFTVSLLHVVSFHALLHCEMTIEMFASFFEKVRFRQRGPELYDGHCIHN
jgi:hypothetical protein